MIKCELNVSLNEKSFSLVTGTEYHHHLQSQVSVTEALPLWCINCCVLANTVLCINRVTRHWQVMYGEVGQMQKRKTFVVGKHRTSQVKRLNQLR